MVDNVIDYIKEKRINQKHSIRQMNSKRFTDLVFEYLESKTLGDQEVVLLKRWSTELDRSIGLLLDVDDVIYCNNYIFYLYDELQSVLFA